MDINDELVDAAKYGDLSEVRKLIKNGASIHTLSDAPLRLAARHGNLEVVKFLIKNGANIHALCDAPLLYAAENGHLEVVKFLIKRGADIHAWNDWNDCFFLLIAAHHGHLEVIKFLEPMYVRDMWNKVKWSEIKSRYNEQIINSK